MPVDFALLVLNGVNSATEAFAAARDRSDPHAPWVPHVGLVEHHENGHLVLRGTFAGRYVDFDEALHTSEHGGEVGFAVGVVIGALLGPLGFAEGVVWGPQLGSEFGKPSETDPEPRLLAEQLRAGVPRSSSAIVSIADARDADELLGAADAGYASLIRRTLTAEELAGLDAALGAWPPASPGPSTKGEQAVEERDGGASS